MFSIFGVLLVELTVIVSLAFMYNMDYNSVISKSLKRGSIIWFFVIV